MMPAEIECDVTTQRLLPPIGGVYHFAAKIRLHKTEDGAPRRIHLPFDEVWGETEEETRQKAQAMIQRLVGEISTVDKSATTQPDVRVAIGA